MTSTVAAATVETGRSWALSTKRLLDFTIALTLLTALLPVLFVLALAVRCSSPGPILFRQTRVGRGGRQFCFYKFRTMRANNDPMPHLRYFQSLVAGTALPVGGRFKLTQDPRVTPIGRLLRRSSLDELPQLLNVLRGEMALVGPRPPIPYETELYQSREWRRLSVTPGLTGLWQVSGRSCLNFQQMIDLDLEYVDNWSLRLDLVILVRTPWAVLRASGAA